MSEVLKLVAPGKRYLVLPGNVRSRNDGQIHFINAFELMRLYCVRREECIIWREGMALDVSGLTPLQPRYDGKYPLFEVKQVEPAARPSQGFVLFASALLAGIAAGVGACPNDTNGDGDCGRPMCPECGGSGIRQRHPFINRCSRGCEPGEAT